MTTLQIVPAAAASTASCEAESPQFLRAVGTKTAGLDWAARYGIATPRPLCVVSSTCYREALASVAELTERLPHDAGPASDLLASVRNRIAALPLAPTLAAEIAACTRRLPTPTRWSVRSSADIEDQPTMSTAGIFSSYVGVEAGALPEAITAVWSSVWTEAAFVYLQHRGFSLLDVSMAVLFHPYVDGKRATVFTADPTQAKPPVTGSTGRTSVAVPVEWETGLTEWRDPQAGDQDRSTELVMKALALAHARGMPLDTEWAVPLAAQDEPVLLQLRAITAYAPPSFPARPPDDRRWIFDATHNPDPLSPAKQELAKRVSGIAGVDQCILAEYLYYCPPAGSPTQDAVVLPRTVPTPLSVARLETTFVDEVVPSLEARLSPLEAMGAAVALPDALSAFDDVYRIYAEAWAPLLAASRSHYERVLEEHGWSTHASALLAGTPNETTARNHVLWQGDVKRFVSRWGAFAPVWDVAVPTYEERPLDAQPLRTGPSPEDRRLRAFERSQALEAQLAATLPSTLLARFHEAVALGRAAFRWGEADDIYFARSQRLVRRALLGQGPAPAIFFSRPLGVLQPEEDVELALRAFERARRLVPPLRFVAGEPAFAAPPEEGQLSGLKGGGRARGIVGNQPGNVLVLKSLEPQNSHRLLTAAALVTDYGGLLGHEMTLAREYGVPAVIGTGIATKFFRPGEEVVVDGEAGIVYRAQGRPPSVTV